MKAILAGLFLATTATGATLPTHAMVTIVQATEATPLTTGDGSWTISGGIAEPVEIRLEWRSRNGQTRQVVQATPVQLDGSGRVVAPAHIVVAPPPTDSVLTLVICRE